MRIDQSATLARLLSEMCDFDRRNNLLLSQELPCAFCGRELRVLLVPF
jgi:hypothetical protein